MSLYDTFRKALTVDSETMVHRGYLDLTGLKIFDGVIGSVVTMVHLNSLRPQS